MSLATRYRPKEFSEVVSQQTIIKILSRQLELNELSHCYLFAGPSGCGKTTIARILANKINKGFGTPIEVDGASNNGVDNVRMLIDEAQTRALDAEYKVIIIDEVHMLTTAGWNAFLKCIEEPPKYTIFMFCTTNPEKIPATILNRVMRFNLSKIPTSLICNRLIDICTKEGFLNFSESCEYISKLAEGGMRDAISMLEKCSSYSTDLSINNVVEALGNFSFDTMFNLTNSIVDRDEKTLINIIENCFNSGNDLKLFVNQYLDFVLDLNKFNLFGSLELTKIPSSMIDNAKYAISFDGKDEFLNVLLNEVLKIKNAIVNDVSVKTTILAMFIKVCRG